MNRDVYRGDVYAVVDSGTLYRYRAGVSWAKGLVGRSGLNGATAETQETLPAHRSATAPRP